MATASIVGTTMLLLPLPLPLPHMSMPSPDGPGCGGGGRGGLVDIASPGSICAQHRVGSLGCCGGGPCSTPIPTRAVATASASCLEARRSILFTSSSSSQSSTSGVSSSSSPSPSSLVLELFPEKKLSPTPPPSSQQPSLATQTTIITSASASLSQQTVIKTTIPTTTSSSSSSHLREKVSLRTRSLPPPKQQHQHQNPNAITPTNPLSLSSEMGSAKRRLSELMESPSKVIIIDHGDGKEKAPVLPLDHAVGETGMELERTEQPTTTTTTPSPSPPPTTNTTNTSTSSSNSPEPPPDEETDQEKYKSASTQTDPLFASSCPILRTTGRVIAAPRDLTQLPAGPKTEFFRVWGREVREVEPRRHRDLQWTFWMP